MKTNNRKEGVLVLLCFGALVKVLKYCAKPKVNNKTLCGAVLRTINGYDVELTYKKKAEE